MDWGELEKRPLATQLGNWIGSRLDDLQVSRRSSKEQQAVGHLLQELGMLRNAATMFQESATSFALYIKGMIVTSRRRADHLHTLKCYEMAEVEDFFADALEAYYERHKPTPEDLTRVGLRDKLDLVPASEPAPRRRTFEGAKQAYRDWEGDETPLASRRAKRPGQKKKAPGKQQQIEERKGSLVMWRSRRPRGSTVFSVATAGMSYDGRSNYVSGIAGNGGDLLVATSYLDLDEQKLRLAYEKSSRILIPGGADIHPSCYGHAEHTRLGYTRPERDRVEYLLASWALEDGKPIMGICRGHQMITAAAGGTLFQDIPSEFDWNVGHGSNDHGINIAPDSQLAAILGTDWIEVNSLHHQATDEVPPGWRAVAWSEDGVIEAIEHPDLPVISVQFHPEMLRTRDKRFNRLFDRFMDL
jgi:putative glutamine amidotransferase